MKLNKNLFDYLDCSLSEQQPELRLKLQARIENQFVFVEVDELIADEIRDWAGEELQKKGFDAYYHLNSEGEILEELIDAFYAA